MGANRVDLLVDTWYRDLTKGRISMSICGCPRCEKVFAVPSEYNSPLPEFCCFCGAKFKVER